jgi:hypothetical protein
MRMWMRAAAIHDVLSAGAVRSAPMEDGHAIVYTGDGFRLECKPCAWYGKHVSEHGVRARSGAGFHNADLAELVAIAGAHRCPPEVRAAAEAARGAKKSATASAA